MESICAALAAGDEAMTGLIGDARFDAVVTEVECEQLIGIFPDGLTRVAITGFNDGCVTTRGDPPTKVRLLHGDEGQQ